MKTHLLVFVIFLPGLSSITVAQYPDLPGGGIPYNVQILPTGSYVIAMDNMNQNQGTAANTTRNINLTNGSTTATLTAENLNIYPGMTVSATGVPAGTILLSKNGTTITLSNAATTSANNRACTFGGFRFNLKAYGLLVTLLNNNKRLRWVIKPGKSKDAFDFSVSATRIRPTATATANYNFSGGPFVIFPQDTAGVAALVQTFNGGASSDDVKLYRTEANVSVDVRYDYLINGAIWRPKGAILSDGGNQAIHTAIMTTASVPATNYAVAAAPNLLTDCYTFASEPHNGVAPTNIIQSIRTFVTNGGNFLAQCEAVRTYEISTFARFQSTNGFDNANENGAPSNWTYSNSDLGYFQINGYFGIEDEGGSLKSWVIPSAPGNPPTNHFHSHNTGASGGRNYTNASVSKLFSATSLGGMVFYLGSHDYAGTQSFEINGQRMYLNAFLVPTNPQGALRTDAIITCPTSPTVVRASTASSSGPIQAYPLTFRLYRDMSPFGIGPEDIQEGNTVTYTAPNTPSGTSVITGTTSTYYNYYVAIQPAGGCLQTKYMRSFCIPLSVEFLSFSAIRNNNNVKLNWITVTEQNSKGFYIERMTRLSSDWEQVGFVSSLAAGGNSTEQLEYTFDDMNALTGISLYRIRQIDYDNKMKLSKTCTVKGLDQKTGLLVYPNPTNNGLLNIVFDEPSVIRTLTVTDMSGRIIRSMNNFSTNNVQITNLKPGMYVIQVLYNESGFSTVQKVIVTK